MLDGPKSELLAMLVSPVLIGFFWLAAATIFQGPTVGTEESREHSAHRFTLLGVSDGLDSDHLILWQSQTPALQLIGSAVSLSALFRFFGHFSSLYPELYEDTTFEAWLRFLQTCDLVARAGREVHLTSKGRRFLNYLEGTGKESRPKKPVH